MKPFACFDYRKSQNGLVNVTDVHLQQVHRELILSTSIDAAYKDIQLSDLEIVSTLGIGGFGRVELVRLSCQFTLQLPDQKERLRVRGVVTNN